MIKPKNALLGAVLLILLGSGLAYGGMVAWAMTLSGVATGVLVTLWAGLSTYGIVTTEISARRFVWPALAFFTVISWALVQSYLPVPADLAHPAWEATRDLVPGIGQGVISVAPAAGLRAIMTLLVYAGMFWLFAQLTRDPGRASVALHAICLIGGAIALIGLVNHLGGPRLLPWLPDQEEVVRSTFINRNNFATYCGFTIIVALGLLLRTQQIERRRGSRMASASKVLGRAIIKGGSLYLTIIVVGFMALVLSGSRAGMGATLLGIVTLTGLHWISGRRQRQSLAPVLTVLAIFALMTLAMGGDFLTARLLTEDLAESERFLAYRDVARAIQDYPLTGIGYGGFAQAYPLYRGEDVGHVRFFVENTYLEMIFELGIPMALVWFGLLASLLRRCFIGALQRQRDQFYPMVASAVGVLGGAHALLDYSLQIPAIALLFAAILGIGVAQSWPSSER